MELLFAHWAHWAQRAQAVWRAVPMPPTPAWVAVYVAVVLNLPVLLRRQQLGAGGDIAGTAAGNVGLELLLVASLTGLLCLAATWFGRRIWLALATLLIIASAVCSYFMARFNVVIGYGVINALLTTDHDMSGELVGVWLLLWLLLLGGLPVWLLWRQPAPPSLWQQRRQRRVLLGRAVPPVLLLAGFLLAQSVLRETGRAAAGPDGAAAANPVGIAAHSYLPSNWIAGLGMVLSNRWSALQRDVQLVDPAKRFRYQPTADLRGLVLVVVIGETARHDRFGLLGHDRPTTPRLSALPHVQGFAATSCDTVTKLSLACMFVRPEGIQASNGLQPDLIREDGLFSVLRHLGFGVELYAMQSELRFYNRVGADVYKFREVIAAQPENADQPMHDGLLVPELKAVLDRARRAPAPQRPTVIVLHTKGSHYLYAQRYPRAFARWQPECTSTDQACSQAQLLNAFDNSILYTDHVLADLIGQLQSHKALLVYTSDHGESIGEGTHFHGTPRAIAPPEQRAVPLVFWASEAFRADQVLGDGYERLAQRREAGVERVGHHNLFASLLGCLGVRSPDGGITASDNLCD